GLNGTVVSLPHCEQTVRVSTLEKPLGAWSTGAAPSTETRFALHALHRLGSFLNCLSWKNSCSPAVKIKSAPQSIHFSTLSWNSIESAPFTPSPLRGAYAEEPSHPPQSHLGNTPGFGPARSAQGAG